METPITPLLADTPRVLIHVRGTMEPAECAFWERLRVALRARGAELLLTAHYWTQTPVDVPVLRARNGLAAVEEVPAQQGWTPWFAESQLLTTEDEQELLEREALWNGPPGSDDETAQRRRALQHYAAFYGAALKLARPALVIIWNGKHPQEMILDRLSRRSGCAVQYLERGPFHGTLHLDPEGILGGSAVARTTSWDWPQEMDRETWRTRLREISAAYEDGGTTWWPQPPRTDPGALRQRLGIKPDDTVLLFAGQVDRDAQSLFYSPHFQRNLDAFAWFCQNLPKKSNVFVLGKHHPMNPNAPEDFAKALGGRRGAWVNDVALADCLAVADRVAAVNSTVLYESLMLGKPVLALGSSLLSNKRIAHEVLEPDAANPVLEAWLEGAEQAERLARWEDFGAWLLATQLYVAGVEESAVSPRGAEALAETLAALSKASPEFGPLTAGECFVDCVALWDESRRRAKRHTGVKEVLRGLNIAAEASLGRVAPGAYRTLLRWGDAAYARLSDGKR